MRAVLDEAIAAAGLDNVDVYAERWPGHSTAPVADVGLISHVGYDIAAIGPFSTNSKRTAAVFAWRCSSGPPRLPTSRRCGLESTAKRA